MKVLGGVTTIIVNRFSKVPLTLIFLVNFHSILVHIRREVHRIAVTIFELKLSIVWAAEEAQVHKVKIILVLV